MRHFIYFFTFFQMGLWLIPLPASCSQELSLHQDSGLRSTADGENQDLKKLQELLNKSLVSYRMVNDYNSIFYKSEKTANGSLEPTQKIFLRYEKPCRIFMRWLDSTKEGLEVLYERGYNEGKLAIHQPGLLLGLMPVVFLEQSSPWVKEGSASYNIEDVGIENFLNEFNQAVTRAVEEKRIKTIIRENVTEDGMAADEAKVSFSDPENKRDFFARRLRVLFDKTTSLPLKMELFDWEDEPSGIYVYKNVKINGGSQDLEFQKYMHPELKKVYEHKKRAKRIKVKSDR